MTTFRMLQHTPSEVTVRYNTIKFKCYGERLEPNLKEITIVKKMIICRPILKPGIVNRTQSNY